jgi:hypothetical protein
MEDAMSARLDPGFAAELASDPLGAHEAILTASDGLEALLSALPGDVDVQYTYRLIGGVAVRASGDAISRLAALPAVKTIEKVKPIQGC